MDVASLVRAARRGTGEGQAQFALRAGVSERALSALEAGGSDPRWSTVERLVRAGGLELAAVPALPDPARALVQHLHRSTSYRLSWSLSADGPRWRFQWQELERLSRRGIVRLDGLEAVGVWLPLRTARHPLPVVLHATAEPDVYVGQLDVLVVQELAPTGLVKIALGKAAVHVPPPLLLADHRECAAHADELRTAAALLDAGRARDAGGRRPPPHRDPHERREWDQVLLRREHRDRELPSEQDSRAWRLGGAASLATWLESHPQRRR